MSNGNNLEFDVLGLNVKFKAEDQNGAARPEDIVRLVREEALMIQAKSPTLERSKIAVLVALKLASDKINLEQECQTNIDKLQSSAKDALSFIEEVIPKF